MYLDILFRREDIFALLTSPGCLGRDENFHTFVTSNAWGLLVFRFRAAKRRPLARAERLYISIYGVFQWPSTYMIMTLCLESNKAAEDIRFEDVPEHFQKIL